MKLTGVAPEPLEDGTSGPDATEETALMKMIKSSDGENIFKLGNSLLDLHEGSRLRAPSGDNAAGPGRAKGNSFTQGVDADGWPRLSPCSSVAAMSIAPPTILYSDNGSDEDEMSMDKSVRGHDLAADRARVDAAPSPDMPPGGALAPLDPKGKRRKDR
eukprot:4534817-Pyramimonas_sp.AAC.1